MASVNSRAHLKWEIPAEVCELDLKNGERSRRRVRDLVTQLAFEGRSQNETERARISMMARSDLLHTRAGYRCARPTIAILKIQLATRGRSIQMGSNSAELGFSHHFHFAVTSGPTASILDRQLRATIRSRGYSMTSSASAKSVGGILRLRVLAVLRLITSSNRVGCSTGSSAGLAPFRIRLT